MWVSLSQGSWLGRKKSPNSFWLWGSGSTLFQSFWLGRKNAKKNLAYCGFLELLAGHAKFEEVLTAQPRALGKRFPELLAGLEKIKLFRSSRELLKFIFQGSWMGWNKLQKFLRFSLELWKNLLQSFFLVGSEKLKTGFPPYSRFPTWCLLPDAFSPMPPPWCFLHNASSMMPPKWCFLHDASLSWCLVPDAFSLTPPLWCLLHDVP